MLNVYTLDLDLNADLTRSLSGLLDANECWQRDRFVQQFLKDRYATAHGALRLILSSHTATHAAAICFNREAFGKPLLASSSTLPLHFSLSHSAFLACIAISDTTPCGVDVEWRREISDAAEILRSILTRAELKVVLSILSFGTLGYSEILQRCWTMKEAVLKATGYGLSIDPIRVNMDPTALRDALARPDRFVVAPIEAKVDAGSRGWTGKLYSFDLCRGFGAVAVSSAAASVVPQVKQISEDWLAKSLVEADDLRCPVYVEATDITILTASAVSNI